MNPHSPIRGPCHLSAWTSSRSPTITLINKFSPLSPRVGLGDTWLIFTAVPDAQLSSRILTGTLSFMQGQALNLFNGDLSSLAFTPLQPQSMLRHNVSSTCPFPPILTATIWVQTLLNSSLHHSSCNLTAFSVPGIVYMMLILFLPFTKWPGKMRLLSSYSPKGNGILEKQSDLSKIPQLGSCGVRTWTQLYIEFRDYAPFALLHST